MAYKKIFDDPNKKKDLTGGVVGGGGGEVASGNIGTGQWNNLQTYLDGNKGQGAGIANEITQKTQADIDAVGTKQNEWQQDASKRVADNTKKDTWSAQINTDPTKIDADAYSAWKAAPNYGGPKDATQDEGYASAYGGVQKSKEQATSANDYYGQKALADNTFNQKGTYTQGMGTLDTFVARADESGKKAFNDFKDKNKDIGKKWENTVKGVNDNIAGAGSKGQSAYDTVMKNITGKAGSINQAAQMRADGNRDRSKAYTHGRSLTNEQVNEPELDKFTKRNGNWGAADEYSQADIDALNRLSGMDDDAATGEVVKGNNFSPYVFDDVGFTKYLAGRGVAPNAAESAYANDREAKFIPEMSAMEAKNAAVAAANQGDTSIDYSPMSAADAKSAAAEKRGDTSIDYSSLSPMEAKNAADAKRNAASNPNNAPAVAETNAADAAKQAAAAAQPAAFDDPQAVPMTIAEMMQRRSEKQHRPADWPAYLPWPPPWK